MRLYASIILYNRSEDAEPQCEAFIGFSGFADGRRKASPDSEEIEQTGTKCRKRNFPSVEQIQDKSRLRHHYVYFVENSFLKNDKE